MANINKTIKNKIDNFKKGDEIISKYTIEEIDSDGLYTLSDNETLKIEYMFEDEIFDLMYENEVDLISNQ